VNEDDPLVVSDEITDSVDRSVIAVPLQEEMRKQPVRHLFAPGIAVSAERIDVVIDLNYNFALGVEGARKKVECILAYLEFLTTQADSAEERRPRGPTPGSGPTRRRSGQFVFAKLTPNEIKELVAIDSATADDASLAEIKKAFCKRLAKSHFASRAIHRIWPDFEMRGLEGA
jgi:hypothetical protein